MRELIAAWRLGMRDLGEEFGSDGAVEDQVSVEELDFLDGLPSFDGGGTGGMREGGVILEFIAVGIGSEGVFRLLEDGDAVVGVGVLVFGVLAEVIVVLRGHRGLIRLGVVGVVMGLGVDRIVISVVRSMVVLVGFIVAVGIWESLDGVLEEPVSVSGLFRCVGISL
jgi:hypothetical protein